MFWPVPSISVVDCNEINCFIIGGAHEVVLIFTTPVKHNRNGIRGVEQRNGVFARLMEKHELIHKGESVFTVYGVAPPESSKDREEESLSLHRFLFLVPF